MAHALSLFYCPFTISQHCGKESGCNNIIDWTTSHYWSLILFCRKVPSYSKRGLCVFVSCPYSEILLERELLQQLTNNISVICPRVKKYNVIIQKNKRWEASVSNGGWIECSEFQVRVRFYSGQNLHLAFVLHVLFIRGKVLMNLCVSVLDYQKSRKRAVFEVATSDVHFFII